MATTTSTTAVDCASWVRVGQLTLRSSAMTSDTNREPRRSAATALVTVPAFCVERRPFWGAGRRLGGWRRDCRGARAPAGAGELPSPELSCPRAGRMRAMLLQFTFVGTTGPEGLEPPTPGFGDRCSTS